VKSQSLGEPLIYLPFCLKASKMLILSQNLSVFDNLMNNLKSMSLSIRTKTKLNVVLIAISAVLLAIYVWPQGVNKGLSTVQSWFGSETPWQLEENPFSLGLDLQGGSHLVYEADVSNLPPVKWKLPWKGYVT